ncbi:MAG TPA: CopD family protein, partial [Ktedonobacterales bacterium]
AERLRWTGLTRAPQRTAVTIEALPTPIASWKDELYATLRATRTLPRRLIDGLLARSPMERIMLLLALTLLTLTAFSGHAAAVTDRLWLSISVDLLHLLAEACWLGGLFYLATLLLPALRTLPPLARARVLAMGLPRFGALAIIAATLLAATGSLSTTVRLTSADQLLGTAYGRTLIIKVEIFLVMALISAYHAFVLRPRLANALTASAKDDAVAAVAAPVAMAGDGMPEPALVMGTAEIMGDKNPLPPEVSGNANRLAGWLRREAVLGVAVLACVSLLGAFAGTLSVPVQPSAAPPAATGDFVGTQAVGPYAMKVTVSPATFGTNTVTAVLTTANTHQPVAGAGVIVTTSDLDMDMGSDHVQLQAVDGSPGTYSGSIDFAMGGRWGLTMQVLPPGGKDYLTTQFTVPVSE